MGIKRKKKVCKECGEERYIYGRGLCNYCYAVDYKNRQREKSNKKTSSISPISSTNTYEDSDGNKWTKQEVKTKVALAKQQKIKQFKAEHGYLVCEDCGRNDCTPIDCSHTISVKEAQESKRVELAWYVPNIVLRGRPCHNDHDKKPREVRERIFEERDKA